MHNWRKVEGSGSYPHFEAMADDFNNELSLLEKYAGQLEPQSLAINQCEISYINKIAIESEAERDLAKWVTLWAGKQIESESIGFSLRHVFRRDNGSPYARMFIDCGSGMDVKGRPTFGLTISMRGAPLETTIASAMDFMIYGRSAIVKKFSEITTPYAHEKWGIKNV
ncbi:hypothetical protein [Duganella violaceipulchra]|uniref:Uncharacterized protein n=1 Tax=Duganella violaceipulchra TaxID=2849652 RepID=A0AA41HG43_9BURK|nr:hypothetical protein [Duganella violaceicalia]MBV6325505.1 hypothetical protein [Duganella violaceicalia]MCP2012677.1 hypothetical protein [Duganella violaceicalia]